jgi:uncharacterized protein YbcC (UPF0753/DUF2309 family)
VIRLSSEIIAYYWPMRAFVHHNPLHGLENYRFAEAVRHGERILGGRGYLSLDTFRDYYRSGRILPRHLNEVLKEYDPADTVEIGGRSISRVEVLRAQLIHGASAPALDEITNALNTHPDRDAIAKLADYLGALRPQEHISNREPENSLRTETLAAWCDRTLDAQIVDLIDGEMIKWSAAFLDEGHATWGMPHRERGFYSAWKFLAQREWSPCGIERSCEKIARLPEHAEDALLESLDAMKIGSDLLQDYLSLHLAALAGWAGFIKWRADQSEYEWQRAYPMDLVQYLAVRLWYERELVQGVCSIRLGVDGNVDALRPAIRARAQELERSRNSTLVRAWRLAALARALEIDPMRLAQRADAVVLKLLEWLDALPETELGRIWLTAFEAGYEEQLIGKLRSDDRMHQTLVHESAEFTGGQTAGDHAVRLQAQAIFCIDVRSESLRRHIEAIGDYETFGFAGFFAVFIRHQALGSHHETDQFPVIVNAKNLVREIPRTYHSEVVFRREHREKLLDAAHTLLYDLKENVLTPYVMVESLGWFYSLPFVGRSLFPDWYRKTVEWLRQKLVPHVATTLTVDKLSRAEVEEMLAAEQRVITRRALQAKFGDRNLNLSLERLDFLRRRAIDEESAGEPSPQARSTALTPEEEALFVEELRRDHGIDRSASFARMERITRTGFTVSEQVLTVMTALKIIGLTSNFARLVLVCGHGSSSENNPFESALDCGACGGNGGKPNARAFAIMANKPQVREQLAQNGIVIPQDTYFIAGQHNTATDVVELFDLEDLPPTHRRDV